MDTNPKSTDTNHTITMTGEHSSSTSTGPMTTDSFSITNFNAGSQPVKNSGDFYTITTEKLSKMHSIVDNSDLSATRKRKKCEKIKSQNPPSETIQSRSIGNERSINCLPESFFSSLKSSMICVQEISKSGLSTMKSKLGTKYENTQYSISIKNKKKSADFSTILYHKDIWEPNTLLTNRVKQRFFTQEDNFINPNIKTVKTDNLHSYQLSPFIYSAKNYFSFSVFRHRLTKRNILVVSLHFPKKSGPFIETTPDYSKKLLYFFSRVKQCANHVNVPWLIMGDMNVALKVITDYDYESMPANINFTPVDIAFHSGKFDELLDTYTPTGVKIDSKHIMWSVSSKYCWLFNSYTTTSSFIPLPVRFLSKIYDHTHEQGALLEKQHKNRKRNFVRYHTCDHTPFQLAFSNP